jgi:uncharacterized protein involved in exopolysaccharide biosynthesis
MYENATAAGAPNRRGSAFWIREVLGMLFRHQRLILGTFAVILLAACAVILLTPARYETELKILIRRDRADPLLSADPANITVSPDRITEEDVNSEVDLLKSRDLMEQVAKAAGLADQTTRPWWAALVPGYKPPDPAAALASAADALSAAIEVEPPKKSHLIRVTYQSSDPKLAARVLNLLGDLYLQKHLAVHRSSGAAEFFQRESERFRENLRNLEQQLVERGQKEGVVAAATEKASVLQALSEAESQMNNTAAQIRGTEDRIRDLQAQASQLPARNTTQVRTSAALQQELRSNLYNLQLKRTELLQKFDPSYRAVQDVEAQIQQVRSALADAEARPLREEVVDQNPLHEMIQAEIARARADLSGLRARHTALAASIQQMRQQTIRLQEEEKLQQDLTRAAKIAEDNYLLYLRKQEEARIGDELDQQRVANVVIAQAATPPVNPATTPWSQVPLAFLLAGVVSLGMGFASDSFDPSVRTPQELEGHLDVPVLGSIPHPSDVKRLGNGRSGNPQ